MRQGPQANPRSPREGATALSAIRSANRSIESMVSQFYWFTYRRKSTPRMIPVAMKFTIMNEPP